MLLWWREFAGCFLSPVAYVVTACYLMLAGATFLQAAERQSGLQESLEVLLFMAMFFWMPLFVTAITMRLFAEEKRSGTLETLMTAPVTDVQVVMGKFAGAYAFLLLAAAPAVAGLAVVIVLSPSMAAWDGGALAGGAILFVSIGALCVSIGLLASLLTRNQIVAALVCFVAICTPFLLRAAMSNLPVGSERLIEYVSAEAHIMDFARGSLDTRPLVLYVSSTAFLLFASVKLLESRRWR